MPLTRDFRGTILARVQSDPLFRREMLKEAVNAFLAGDVETGKALLRDYIHSTITFAGLSEATGKSSKSLLRMLGPSGNPTAENIFLIIRILQESERLHLQVKAAKPKAA